MVPDSDMSTLDDISISRETEKRAYFTAMKEMYRDALRQNNDIYEIAFALTDEFKEITAESILKDPRIIRILRYSVAPSISQMKFGQMLGIPSVDKFERIGNPVADCASESLNSVAEEMARFFRENLDEQRFPWIANSRQRDSNSFLFARNWTCALAADQNAQTNYRNWRRSQQELAISSQLVTFGYKMSDFKGVVLRQSDIPVGEYTKEVKVRGRTIQKADIVIRSKKTDGLVLIEAKTVGVEIDATKRIKECCDKASDWKSSAELANPNVAAVIAGFFSERNIENLRKSEVQVVWEHRLQDLGDII